jgi:hypothetical protein
VLAALSTEEASFDSVLTAGEGRDAIHDALLKMLR